MALYYKRVTMFGFSGQDVERGTFSHRHAVVKVEDSEKEVVLLNNISSEQGGVSYLQLLIV